MLRLLCGFFDAPMAPCTDVGTVHVQRPPCCTAAKYTAYRVPVKCSQSWMMLATEAHRLEGERLTKDFAAACAVVDTADDDGGALVAALSAGMLGSSTAEPTCR